MKILIVSGFLGAGKTTFIKEMARKTHRDFVIMENEYGEVGIDKTLLDKDSDINIWELTEGCICCSMKSDFASSILTIANTLDPEYLIVEPTGVGVLSNVIQNIRQIEYERITLLNPVTIVDADCFDHYLQEYPDIFRDQIRAAGTVVVSKRNFLSREEEENFRLKLHSIHPDADIVLEHYTHKNLDWWEHLLNTDLKGNSLTFDSCKTPDLENFGLEGISLPSPTHIIQFLEDLIRNEFGQICRAKGLIPAGNCTIRFDVVDDRYSICEFKDSKDAKCIFIGKNLQRNLIRKRLFAGLRTKAKIRQGPSLK